MDKDELIESFLIGLRKDLEEGGLWTEPIKEDLKNGITYQDLTEKYPLVFNSTYTARRFMHLLGERDMVSGMDPVSIENNEKVYFWNDEKSVDEKVKNYQRNL